MQTNGVTNIFEVFQFDYNGIRYNKYIDVLRTLVLRIFVSIFQTV